MKRVAFLLKTGSLLLAAMLFIATPGCKDDDEPDDNNNNTKEPEWKYDTQEIPYGSIPWVSGGLLVVCSKQKNLDLGTVHCLNSATGALFWKTTDSTVTRTSPVVYDDYVIYGGINVHALNIHDGGNEWDYQDEILKVAVYSSPLLHDGYVYFGSTQSMIKLDATTGGRSWKNDDQQFFNAGLPAPVFSDGKIYYATLSGFVFQLDAGTGTIGWPLEFENGLDNAPVVTPNTILVGVHEADPGENSLFCYQLDGSTLNWSQKIGQVLCNMTLNADKLYVVGNTMLFCLSSGDGSEMWHYEMSAGSNGAPAVTGGNVYVGNGNGLLCLDATTGSVKWRYATPDKNGFGGPVVSGTKVYVSCEDGYVYCFPL
ncbi:MAG TPA: PQQ-binding-like beta-propeller repeat protein [Bacteroidales bacterium]|nr:PQQ-binding-like beta-propeller repeat protein [Bacteroidales bacterium]HRZ20029.1 PQQ-binding-like beta-propeller repeat protein [Bacteroidales bacterium]